MIKMLHSLHGNFLKQRQKVWCQFEGLQKLDTHFAKTPVTKLVFVVSSLWRHYDLNYWKVEHWLGERKYMKSARIMCWVIISHPQLFAIQNSMCCVIVDPHTTSTRLCKGKTSTAGATLGTPCHLCINFLYLYFIWQSNGDQHFYALTLT